MRTEDKEHSLGTFPPEIAVEYNKIMTYFDYDKNVDIFDKLAREHIRPFPSNPRVLELGIGTGHFASRLVNLEYEVIGIDDSPKMIEILREKHPSLDAKLQNAAELDLPGERFDVVVSPAGPIRFNYFLNERIFESYIPDWELTKDAIRRVRQHLHPNGLLIMSQNSDSEHPGFFKSTGDDMPVPGGRRYQKNERREGEFIYKMRSLSKDSKLLVGIEHRFVWRTPQIAEATLDEIGFKVIGFDPTNTYHISRRK